MPFLTLSSPLLRAIRENGYTHPTPIQRSVIPLVLAGEDILARAQTGSGKSASFVLPILEQWSRTKGEGKAKIKALILTPTRELTLQVAHTFVTLGAHFPIPPKVVSIIGGEGIGEQLFAIQKGCDIVVATSGRFLDVLDKKQMNLDHLAFFVLDEADKMVDFGFAQELESILASLPPKRQNLLFSATYPPKMVSIIRQITHNPIEVVIESEEPTVEAICQRVIEVNPDNRGPLLRHILETEGYEQVLVFMANKRASDNIAAKFRKYGFRAASFNGDLSQEDRTHTLEQFKAKNVRILFATDIAARGLDIAGINCVVNFDLPRSPADYIHRIGRTGRAGESGVAISFIGFEERDHFALIEKRSSIKLSREQIAGFELTGTPPPKQKGPEPIKGKGKSKKDKRREQSRS